MNHDLDGMYDFIQVLGDPDLVDEYLVGDWNGDGRDNLAIRRRGRLWMDTDFDGETDFAMKFGSGTGDDR